MLCAMAMESNTRGLLRVVPPQDMAGRDATQLTEPSAITVNDDVETSLAKFIRERWEVFRNHRSTAKLDDRLLAAQRMFNGEYDPTTLAEIKRFGGSEIFARLVAVKCRGATSLLREVYVSSERPWSIEPTPEPTIPSDISASIAQLVASEVQNLQNSGMPVTEEQVDKRVAALKQSAKMAAKKQASVQAKSVEDMLDDYLVEGNFYRALADILVDLPLFPYVCMKGPVVRIVPDVRWVQGQPMTTQVPKMFWDRVSPFDVYWDPGVSDIADGSVIEKMRVSRSDLNDCIGLPGYNDIAIKAVLDLYGRGGLVDWITSTDSQRATGENRENPHLNQSHMIDCLEFHGPVQGRTLLEAGFPPEQITDPLRDIYIQAWLIGRYVIKAQITPSPRKRHPYYITSFEKVPGTPAGNGLPDILADVQSVANATLRALVNNMSISSGPQVVVDTSRLIPGEDADSIYPWKRWKVHNDPNIGVSNPPVLFSQPNSHAQELFAVYNQLGQMADELSAIPRYSMGSERTSGAGRTSSGLAMLMTNAGKILQTVAANVDRDILDPLLQYLFDIVMLTTGGKGFTGDEAIRVKGVATAQSRAAEKAQQLQFLQITGNPIDMQIIGPTGRAAVLRSVAEDLNLPEQVVPDEETLKAQQAAQMEQQALLMQAEALKTGAPAGGGSAGGGVPQNAQNAAETPGRPLADANRRLDIMQKQDPRALPKPSGMQVG